MERQLTVGDLQELLAKGSKDQVINFCDNMDGMDIEDMTFNFDLSGPNQSGFVFNLYVDSARLIDPFEEKEYCGEHEIYWEGNYCQCPLCIAAKHLERMEEVQDSVDKLVDDLRHIAT